MTTLIKYWLKEYKIGIANGDAEEVRDREEAIRDLRYTNMEAFLDWCADNSIVYNAEDVESWEATFEC